MTEIRSTEIRVGIIGTGAVASEHARAIARLPGAFSLSAAADISEQNLERFAQAFNVRRCHDSAAAVIDDPDVRLVVISTPPATHELLVEAALAAGKYVLCEKPLAHSLAAAVRIADAAARYPGRAAVGYQFRYDLAFRRLAWLCRNGWLGEIQNVNLARHSYVPRNGHGTAWWGTWDVAGGGVVVTQLIHQLDQLLEIAGRPVSVDASIDTRFTAVESEDYASAVIRFENGCTARCVASVDSGHLGGGLTVIGTLGTASLPWGLSFRDPSRREEALRAVANAIPDGSDHPGGLRRRIARLTGRTDHDGPAVPHVQFYRAIAGAIAANAPLPVPPTDALGSLELCAAIYEAGITGTTVSLPLNPQSPGFRGVTRDVYAGRKRRMAPAVAMTSAPALQNPERVTLQRVGKHAARRVLALLNVQPAAIRSLVRRPQPVHGSAPAWRWPWPPRRHFDARERRAVLRVLNREIRAGGAVVYGGPEEEAYCREFAEYLGGGYADAVNSGTTALFVAIRALDLPAGSEVIVPPISDPGGVMPVALNMCVPVPADAEPGSLMPSADQIRAVLTERTSAIVVAHLGGHPMDVEPVLRLADEAGIPVIEDCAQAHGATYRGSRVGSLGTLAVFSTMYGKHHATGAQGGVVFSRDPVLVGVARRIADRGKPFGVPGAPGNLLAGLNLNQDELSMAIGRVQLQKLPQAIARRRRIARHVQTALEGVGGVSLVGDPPQAESSFWFLMIRVDPRVIRCDSREFAMALQREGIGNVHEGYAVFPTDQPWFREAQVFGRTGLPWSLYEQQPPRFDLPNAHAANRQIVRIEIHESLRPRHVRAMVHAIKKVASYYS